MNRVRTLGSAVALAGVAMLAAPAAWAADTTTPPPSATPDSLTPSPTPAATQLVAPPVAALPRAVALTSRVSRQVAPPGTGITVSGTGCVRVHVVVDAPPTGWDDVPPRVFDRTVSAIGGAWHTAFRMPDVVSTVEVRCLDPGSTGIWGTTVAPVDKPAHTDLITTLGDGRLSLRLILVDEPEPAVSLLTDQGVEVPYTLGPSGLVFRRPAGAASVVVIGWHDFGENASARNQGAPVSFTAQLPVVTTPTPTPTATTTGDGLAPSGGPGALLPIALLLIAGGAALALRPGTSRASIPART